MSLPPLPFLSFLSGAVALGNAPALIDDAGEQWMKYGELREQIQKYLPIFSKAPQRGLILCALPRTVNGVIAYLAAAASGHALLLIDPDVARPDAYSEAYEPDWVILPSATRPGPSYSALDSPLPGLFLWQRDTPSAPPPHPDLFLLLLPPGPPQAVKTVRLSYANIASNTAATIAAIGFDTQTRPLLHMPLAYSFGLSLLHMTLSVGASLMLTEHDMKDRTLWDRVAQRDVTLFAGIPFHYEYFTRAGLDNLHVPRLKTFLQAGGRMSLERTQDILRQVTARGGALYIMYGMTEAAPRISSLPLHETPEKAGSFGLPVGGGTFSVEGSRVIYRGPNVMMGYAQGRADLALGDTQGGILPLPDPTHLDEDGYLYLD